MLWGAARNSVTFDENFHLPSGVVAVTRGDLGVSVVNPPLVKVWCALWALGAGAEPPAPAAIAKREQSLVGESFMRVNAPRYHRVYFAARCGILALSLGLGMLIWRFARRLYGPAAGVLAVGFYALAPEALAHAGLVTMDLATGLAMLGSVYAFWVFARSGRWAWWGGTALGVGCFFLTRFSAWLLGPVFLALALLATVRRRARRPLRLWLGLALLLPVTLALLSLGYLGQTTLRPLRAWKFESRVMQRLQAAVPGARLPLPDRYLEGFDWQAYESELGTPTYLFGRIRTEPVWYYFPLALLFKWPLGFLAALLVRGGTRLGGNAGPGRRWHGAFLALPVAVYLFSGMFLAKLNVGVRYMFPLLPFLCVWLGGMLQPAARITLSALARHKRRVALAAGLAVMQGVEAAAAAPWHLSFFNWPAGGPGGGYHLLNDSNVDWGQGLIALRDEMKRRGIARIHLTYHGTTDPAVYGIAYLPFFGGEPSAQSEWLAVSSYYFVGLGQRMMMPWGRTGIMRFDFREFEGRPRSAMLAGSIYLFYVPQAPIGR